MSNSPVSAHSPLNIAVLLGGQSAEREISLKSGAAVISALKNHGHHITPIDPADTNPSKVNWADFDAVFIALHGTCGEDGEIQFILETAGVAFTGSSSGASRLSFSKTAAKERMVQFGVPTPFGILIHQTDSAARIHDRMRGVGFPLVVKPDAQGSSLGVTIVRNSEKLPSALTDCFHFHPFGLLEQFIEGTEWTVSLIDDEILPPICIAPQTEFFDFHAKYRDDATGYDFDGGVSPSVRDTIGQTAQRACRALGTRGAARVDLILDGRDRPWILEVNTIPGLTDHSLLPKSAAQAGCSFADLCENLIRRALANTKRRAA